jgi:hypothetical protein
VPLPGVGLKRLASGFCFVVVGVGPIRTTIISFIPSRLRLPGSPALALAVAVREHGHSHGQAGRGRESTLHPRHGEGEGGER